MFEFVSIRKALCGRKKQKMKGKYQFLTEIYCERDVTWENCETNNFALFAVREVEGKKFKTKYDKNRKFESVLF